MKILQHIVAASLITGSMLVIGALAQEPAEAVPEVELDYFLEEGGVKAQILEMNPEVRMLTVQMDDEKAHLIVPENADIVRTFPNDIEREIALDDLHVGDEITIEGYRVDDVIHIRIIGVTV